MAEHTKTALILLCAVGCGGELIASGGGGQGGTGGEGASYDWGLPVGIPKPKVPDDNPMTPEKVALGRHLFYDTRLSGNETFSCATCHRQELAFTDGLPFSEGSTGDLTPRSSMSLTNVAYLSNFTWANPAIPSLELQAKIPMFGEFPVELGLAGQEEVLFERLRAEPIYEDLFRVAFPDRPDPIDLESILKALAAFERSLLSFGSPFDRFAYDGDPDALTESQKRGRDLFFSERTECHHCHGGFNFTDTTLHENTTFEEEPFHNTGLYNLDGEGAYPEGNRGLYEITFEPGDMGRFRAPSLRNVAVTAPYMHDGSIATLSEVVDHYARGGRLIAEGPFAGDGAENPLKSEFVQGFELSDSEKADLVAFLEALTDPDFLANPAFSNPWTQP